MEKGKKTTRQRRRQPKDKHTNGEDSAFRNHGDLDCKGKTGKRNELMDHVELFLLFMSAVAGAQNRFQFHCTATATLL
jgi:hypothetical protein